MQKYFAVNFHLIVKKTDLWGVKFFSEIALMIATVGNNCGS